MRDHRPYPRWLVVGGAWLAVSCGAAIALSASSKSSKKVPKTAAPVVPASAAPARASKGGRKACSPDMALVEQTCVDRYEAHLLEPGADGKLVPHAPYLQPDKGTRYVAASSAGTKPQAFICQVDAEAACENAGKRLCRLTEWYRACTTANKTTYPYGASYERGKCNVGKTHLLSILHGASVGNWSYADFNDPKLAQTPGFLALTGEYTGCVTPEGVSDLVGNLHEWVADRVDKTLRSKLPVPAVVQRRIGQHPGNGIFMGGFFSTMNQHGDGCNYVTAAHDPHYHDYSTGFRCCKDAEE